MEKKHIPFLKIKTRKEISLLNKLWKVFQDPLLRPIEVIGTVTGAFLIFHGFSESNRITWLTSISANSQELAKMEIEHDYLTCLYPSQKSEIILKLKNDNICDSIYLESIYVRKATLYLENNLDFLEEVIDYDKYYATSEFINFYQPWYDDLHHNNITEKFRTESIEKKIIRIDQFISTRTD